MGEGSNLMGDAGEYWRDAKAGEARRAEQFWNSKAGKAHLTRTAIFWKKFYRRIKDSGLEHKEFEGLGHHRVSNGKQSFDFWSTTETVKTVDGSYESGWKVLTEQLDILLKENQ